MLNIGKLRSGGENYYLNSVARGVEDYYVGSGEAPGYWLASGAKELGLEGEVTPKALRNILGGGRPSGSKRLIAEPRKDRIPGFDLTFRAPKSVALLHALGPKEASNEVVNAHDAAVTAALGYLERTASQARRGKGGRRKIASKGFIGAAFRHRTSRAGDPLLHTHVLVANLIQGADGKWGALDARHLYLQAKTAGYLYQAHLRAELTRRLGLQWQPVRNGAADLEGFSRKVIQAFSKRRQEIDQATAARGQGSGRAAQIAALATRKAKDYSFDPQTLLPEWQDRAEKVGLDLKSIEALLDREIEREITPLQRANIETSLSSATGLTAQASTFGRREAIQGFCGALEAGANIEDIERFADSFLESNRVVALPESQIAPVPGAAEPMKREPRYSTPEMLGVERRVVQRAIERSLDGVGIADEAALASALETCPGLFADQRVLVQRLTTSGMGVEVVVGKAGSGKTYALDAARAAWEASGHHVVGCALAAKAAQELQAGSGIPSFTISSLRADLEGPSGSRLPERTVLVVDEAGMVGTRTLDWILDHAHNARAKVVLVGDDRQLPEIEAGGGFRGIKDRLSAIELTQVRRQPMGWEREALECIRLGNADQALEIYSQHDRVHIEQSTEATRERLVDDWWETQGDEQPGVMIAARRNDVADLNRRARIKMAEAGQLGDQQIEVNEQCFAVGDRVMTLKNARSLGVINGTCGVVEAINLGCQDLTIRTEAGASISLPGGYLEQGHLTHAYAITGHKSQGMTTEKAFVLGDETLYREWTYVAMSRGKTLNHLYVVAGADPEREDLGGRIAEVDDPVKELVRAVGRSHAKEMALDSFESDPTNSDQPREAVVEESLERDISLEL